MEINKNRNLRKWLRRRRGKETSLDDINPSNYPSLRNGCSRRRIPTDYRRRDLTLSNNENWRDNVPFQQEELRSTNGWEPTGDLLENETQFTHDMKILNDYFQSEKVSSDDEYNIFFDTLRTSDYVQALLKERYLHIRFRNIKKVREIRDFIFKKIDSILNVFHLADKGKNFSEMQRKAIASSEKVLEAIKSQLIDCDMDCIDCSSVNSTCEAASPRCNQEQKQDVEEVRKEVYMLLEQLKGTQNELEKTKKEMKDQMDVVEQKDLVPKLLEIRASLEEKIQCSGIYTTGSTAEQIMLVIKWLIKDKIGEKVPDNANSSKFVSVTEYEVHLITMIASYLRTVSFSVNLDFIYSYVEKIDNVLSRDYIESLLKKYPTFFQEESVSAGSEKKWTYLELKPIVTI